MKKIIIFLIMLAILYAKDTDKTISYQTYQQIKHIQKLLKHSKNQQSLKELDKLIIKLQNLQAKKYEICVVERMRGFVYLTTKNYTKAIKSFQKVLKEGLFAHKENIKLMLVYLIV